MTKQQERRVVADDAIIATRELCVAGSRRKVVVTLYKPRQLNDLDWVCEWRMTGMRKPRREIGGDSFQALVVAQMGIRQELNSRGISYTHVAGARGEHGFPLIVLDGFGPRWDAHIERVIDRELTKFVQAELRRRRRDRGKS